MVIVTSLYICISYIYTYSYKLCYLSSLHSYCISIFFVTCFQSLTLLLSILFMYSSDDTYTYACLSCVHSMFQLFIQVCLSYIHIKYDFHGYILYHLLCSMFMYCVNVLISYTVFLFYFSYYFFFHISFSDHFTFLYIFI